jgi:S1-C subfamily serine protease
MLCNIVRNRKIISVSVAGAPAVAALLLAACGGSAPAHHAGAPSLAAPGSRPASPSPPASSPQRSTAGLVDIQVIDESTGQSGSGTGLVFTSSGEVVTNAHVIDAWINEPDANKDQVGINVTDVSNGHDYRASVVGYDSALSGGGDTDVAVLHLTNASGLRTVSIGSNAYEGESVTAVGNAGGTNTNPSSSAGTVNGIDQTVTLVGDNGTSETLSGLTMTTADTWPGDSGGALEDSAGQVVGMNVGASISSASSNFAIPVSQVTQVAGAIEKCGCAYAPGQSGAPPAAQPQPGNPYSDQGFNDLGRLQQSLTNEQQSELSSSAAPPSYQGVTVTIQCTYLRMNTYSCTGSDSSGDVGAADPVTPSNDGSSWSDAGMAWSGPDGSYTTPAASSWTQP